MGARPHEVDEIDFDLVNQKKVTADVAFAVVGPFPYERVVFSLWPQRRVVGDQKHHCLFEARHVVATGVREPFPVFEE